MRRRRVPHIVDMIPSPVWEALTSEEKGVLFAVEDCMQGRFDTAELRRRLDEQARLKLNWWLHDHGLPMVRQ